MTTQKLRVSVALCTYNGSRFLPEQLASIAAQTRLPDELVVCDDGSSDATPQIVADFGNSAPFPVRFFRNPRNLGSTKNFEQAIGLCTGDLIALCDQDDIWLPEKMARQAEMMEHDPALGGVFSDAELVDDKSQPIGKRLWASYLFTSAEQRRFKTGKGVAVLLKRNVVTGATLMIRSDLQSLFGPIPDMWVHDGWIAWMMILYSTLALIEDPLIQYRLHAGQQIGVEAIALHSSLSLLERLRKGKLEEPAKQRTCVLEMEELGRRLQVSHVGLDESIFLHIRQKTQFLNDRADGDRSRLLRITRLLFHLKSYRLYESGYKCLLRDVIMMFV